MKLLVTLLVVPAACLVGSYAMARALVAANGGFGGGDVSTLVYSTVPFAAVLLLVSFVLLVLPKRHLILRLALALIIGATSGFIWTVYNRWMLGPWFGAWSFPVVYCWMVGGHSVWLAQPLFKRRS